MAHITDVLPSLVSIAGDKARGGPGTGLPLMLSADEAVYFDAETGLDRRTNTPAELPLDGYDVFSAAI